MAQLSSELFMRLTDGVTGPAKRVVGSLRGVTAAARSSTMAAVRSMNRMTSAVTAGVGAMGLYKAHETVKQFATATNKLSAANPDFGLDQIKEVARLAREVSRQSLFDPATVMEAANSLARADVSLDAIKGTLKPLATAAMAADVSINELSDDFVKLASNFGMSLKTSKDAAKMLDKPLSALDGFRDGPAEEAGAKMMQGYPAAIKKVSDAFQSLIERLDEAGAIDGFARALTFLGDAVITISNGSAGFKEWAAGLVLVAPAPAAPFPPPVRAQHCPR